MATVRLTDASIRKIISDAASGTRMELTDAATTGLKIRATADGRAVWSIKLRDMSGKQIRINLGEYPNLGISDARHEAAAARHKVRHEGKNPNDEKKALREAALTPIDEGMTLKGLIEIYDRNVWTLGNMKSRPDAIKRIKSVFAKFLDRPLKSIKRSELQIAVDEWPAKSSAGAAVRYLRPVLKWGEKRNYAAAELALLEVPRRSKKRSRFLTPDELKAVITILKDRTDSYSAAMRFILFTGARREQVTGARWQEMSRMEVIDASAPSQKRSIDVWTIPIERIKNTRPDNKTRPHIIPLTRQALSFLEKRRKPNSKLGDLIFPSEQNTVIVNWDRFTKQLHLDSKVSGWHRHDLRRTVSTTLGELQVPPFVIEAVLGHGNIYTDLAGLYNLSKYLIDSSEALQQFSDFIDRIMEDEPTKADP